MDKQKDARLEAGRRKVSRLIASSRPLGGLAWRGARESLLLLPPRCCGLASGSSAAIHRATRLLGT